MGGVTGPQLLEGGFWEKGVTFFSGGGGGGGGGGDFEFLKKKKN